MQSLYQHILYGDAARGCPHRDNGPDARERDISHNRQRLGDLIRRGFATKPVGLHRRCVQKESSMTSHKGIKPAKPWNLGSVSLSEGGKKMAAKKKAAKKPAAKKKAAKKK